MRWVRRERSSQGQAMVEFGLAVGLFLLVIGGLIQFAAILWTQNTVNQIARDTARWAVTQSVVPCDSATTRQAIANTANALASQWSLIDRRTWASASMPSVTPSSGVGVAWNIVDPPVGMTVDPATDCPASDNRLAWFVTVRINHTVPIFVPGLQLLSGGCGPGFCLSSITELRMEPKRPT